ncbi:MAG: hypothetical protein M3540_03965 [Actinomycetota bacterium]|nr:hypothetical protein [Actinomycetota bacterium]
MTAWLKVIGTSKWPLRDDWGTHAPPLLRSASFGKKPGKGSFVPGDDFVYYALRGDLSRVVAIGKVVGPHRFDQSRVVDPGWPWLADVEIHAKRDRIQDGFALDLLDVDRALRRSVTQKSHIRLTASEFERARDLFGT